jgi:hypothetical protein
MTNNSIQEAQEFERHIDEESGMNQAVQASQGFGSNRTLGGISLEYSAAVRPVRLIAKGFENNLIAKGLKKIFTIIVQNAEDEFLVRLTNNPKAPEYIHVSPFDLAVDMDFLASGSFALTQRDQVVQGMTAFFDSLSKLPMVSQMPNWNWKFMVQRLYEAIGLKDFNKVWLDQPPQPTMGVMNGEEAEGGEGLPAGDDERTSLISAMAALGGMAGRGEGEGA